MNITSVFLLLFLVTCSAATGSRKKKNHEMQKMHTHPTEHWFLDQYNRVRVFHGFNSVMKGFPWYHDYLMNNTRLDDMEKFGLNIIRLGTMWSGMEPEDGVYNGTYVDIMRDIIDRLAERGVYAMLDMHQDCLSSYATYDGVPQWVIDSFPEPTNHYHWPLDEITAWEQNYLTQAVSEHFQCLYNDTSGAMEKWANFWEFTAQQYGSISSVIGYDYINEPWVGDFYSDERLLLPGVASRQNLQPSYDLITEKIRQVDTESIVFYEPIAYGVLFDSPILGSGFNRVPGGDQYQNVSAYSWHAYCWNLEVMPPDAPAENRTAAKEFCEDNLIPQMFNTTWQTVEKVGGAAILTEFGLCKTDDSDYVDIECITYLDLADEWIHSWTEWDHNDNKWYHPDGSWKWDKIEPHVRTYPQATAGTPTYMHFDNDNLDFEFEFTTDPSIEMPTEIFVPSLRYTNGYNVDMSDELSYEMDGDYLYVYNDGEEATNVYVHIKALY